MGDRAIHLRPTRFPLALFLPSLLVPFLYARLLIFSKSLLVTLLFDDYLTFSQVYKVNE